ncbi:hypothetical protein ED733_008767 [Metarhizium rileyi]|uniref:Uncharacterized protein n=1 Tax=Metarhizium rileyi (strain RCEF 4871) TaxID=1649241 RepID=A0A5C6GND1_METRR|nr:hypothetical protein ED733_008767 [Metarhizium rileyi]
MAAKRAIELRIDIASLPDIAEPEIDFRDTSFFRLGDPLLQLPSPALILQQFPDKGAGIVKFEHLSLAVKFGDSSYLRLEEAQTMRAIRQVFANKAWPTLTKKDKTLIRGDLSRIVRELRQVGQGSSGCFSSSGCFIGKYL